MPTTHTHTSSKVLQQLLVDHADGLGTAPSAGGAWPVYVGHMPDAPDNAICVYDTDGRTERRPMRARGPVVHPGVQVRVRALDYETAATKAKAIQDALDSIYNTAVTVNTDNYVVNTAHRRGNVFYIGRERTDGQRDVFTINYNLTLTNV